MSKHCLKTKQTACSPPMRTSPSISAKRPSSANSACTIPRTRRVTSPRPLMFDTLRKWRNKRVLRTSGIPDSQWREALEHLPFLAIYTDAELARLRQLVVLFLADKSIVGADGFQVTPIMRVLIAVQACVLILNLDPRYFDGWENVIVYPDEFIPGFEFIDDAGVVHKNEE